MVLLAKAIFFHERFLYVVELHMQVFFFNELLGSVNLVNFCRIEMQSFLALSMSSDSE